jgi:hypothetical protein
VIEEAEEGMDRVTVSGYRDDSGLSPDLYEIFMSMTSAFTRNSCAMA